MNKYKLLFKIFFVLCFFSLFLADINGKSLEEKGKSGDKNIVTYSDGEKNLLEQDNSKNNNSKKNLGNQSDEDCEAKDVFATSKILGDKKATQYNITGAENKFKLSDKELKSIYNIDGTETVKYSRKLVLTKYQEAQIKYLEMERKYKILVLDNEIDSKKKMLNEELASDFSDVFLIDALSKDIKSLAVDKQTIDINVDKKIRYVLTSEQYLKYKQKQNNKRKKNK